jgi:enoyl-CoA hydratase/carnithine racemase/predicted GNAT family acetyltransferase
VATMRSGAWPGDAARTARGLRNRVASRGLCTVQHVASANKFTFGDAVLAYKPLDGAANVIDAVHTAVPKSQRGSGAAAKLCDALFAHAQAEDLKVVPTCSYISDKYVPSHPESQPRALCSVDSSVRGLQIEVAWHGVATLRLTDARRRNPLHAALLDGMRRYLSTLADADAWPAPDEDAPSSLASGGGRGGARVGCVVLESSGPVFSSGHDFGDFAGASSPAEVRRILELCADVNMLLQSIPQVSVHGPPWLIYNARTRHASRALLSLTACASCAVQVSVAAVNGGAYAGGAQLAASCDLVLAQSESASFMLTGVHGHGFCHTPAVAYTHRLPTHKALELAVLGETVDAHEAARIGLANRAVAPAEWRMHVDGVAARLAASFGRNLADGKRTLYQQAQAPDLVSKYGVATDAMVEMFLSKPWQAHMAAFQARKRKPKD